MLSVPYSQPARAGATRHRPPLQSAWPGRLPRPDVTLEVPRASPRPPSPKDGAQAGAHAGDRWGSRQVCGARRRWRRLGQVWGLGAGGGAPHVGLWWVGSPRQRIVTVTELVAGVSGRSCVGDTLPSSALAVSCPLFFPTRTLAVAITRVKDALRARRRRLRRACHLCFQTQLSAVRGHRQWVSQSACPRLASIARLSPAVALLTGITVM